MPLDQLVRYISRLCAEQGQSLYTIGDRHGWPEERITEFLLGRRAPTATMLRDMARELKTPLDDLKRCLNR